MNESLHPLARMHVTNLKRKDNNQREEKKKKLTLKRRKDYKVINSVKITSLRKGSNTSVTIFYYNLNCIKCITNITEERGLSILRFSA